MKLFAASQFKQEGPDLTITQFSNYDMGGYVPNKLLYMCIGAMMGSELTKVYDQVKAM